jgi:uncharacterized protein
MFSLKTVEYDSAIAEIGVLSDTHIPARASYLPPALFSVFDGVRLILHAGDLVDEKVITELSALAPVEAVAGNMDPPALQAGLGKLKLITVGPVLIGLLHGDIAGRRISFSRVRDLFRPADPQVIVFGHVHEPLNREEDGVLFFNPGSAVDPRRVPRPSVGKLKITGTDVRGEIIYL